MGSCMRCMNPVWRELADERKMAPWNSRRNYSCRVGQSVAVRSSGAQVGLGVEPMQASRSNELWARFRRQLASTACSLFFSIAAAVRYLLRNLVPTGTLRTSTIRSSAAPSSTRICRGQKPFQTAIVVEPSRTLTAERGTTAGT